MEEPLAYTPKGAAKATGQGRTTIFQDIKSGKLRAVKNGRRTLILRPDLEEYLSSMPTRAAGFLIVLGTVASLYSAAHHLPQREFVVKISDEYSRDSRLSDEVRVAERLVRKVADIRARAHGDYRALVARHVRRGPGSAPADFYPTPRDLTRGLIDGLAPNCPRPGTMEGRQTADEGGMRAAVRAIPGALRGPRVLRLDHRTRRRALFLGAPRSAADRVRVWRI
jgi:excisionase family DNA binding protein